MNPQLKKRVIIGSIVIVAVVIAVAAVVGSTTSAKSLSVAQAQSTTYVGKKIQVQGNVVDNSYTTSGKTAVFKIYDPDDASAGAITVHYDGALSSTFGNGVIAICTGTMQQDGVLKATELVTKCPSKYENASDAISVSKLLGYGATMNGKPVKVSGEIKSGTLTIDGNNKTFTLIESTSDATLNVSYEGALADSVGSGSSVILTGAITSGNDFVATEVNLKG